MALGKPWGGKKKTQRTNQRGLLATPNKNGNAKPKGHKALVAAESAEPVPKTAFSWGFAGLKEQAVTGFSSKSGQTVQSNTFLVPHSKHKRAKQPPSVSIYLTVLHSSFFPNRNKRTDMKCPPLLHQWSLKTASSGAEARQHGDADVPRLCCSMCPMGAPSSCWSTSRMPMQIVPPLLDTKAFVLYSTGGQQWTVLDLSSPHPQWGWHQSQPGTWVSACL